MEFMQAPAVSDFILHMPWKWRRSSIIMGRHPQRLLLIEDFDDTV
jgi:hypothetical protein